MASHNAAATANTTLTFHPARDDPDRLKRFLGTVLVRYEEDRRQRQQKENSGVNTLAKAKEAAASSEDDDDSDSSSGDDDDNDNDNDDEPPKDKTTTTNPPGEKRKQAPQPNGSNHDRHVRAKDTAAAAMDKATDHDAANQPLEALQDQFQALRSSNADLRGQNQQLKDDITKVKDLLQTTTTNSSGTAAAPHKPEEQPPPPADAPKDSGAADTMVRSCSYYWMSVPSTIRARTVFSVTFKRWLAAKSFVC